MKRILTIAAAVCLLCSAASAESATVATQSSTTTNSSYTTHSYGYEYFIDYLKSSGRDYTETESGITFYYGEKAVSCLKTETKYANLITYRLGIGTNRNKLLEMCNKYNNKNSVIKFAIDDDNDLLISYEFMPRPNMTSDDWEGIMAKLVYAAITISSEF